MNHQKTLAAALAVSLAACSSGSTGPGEGEGFSAALVGLVQPGPPSQRYTDVWGYRDPATGREYALVGSMGNLFVVDASDPATPVTVATLAVPAFDVKVWGSYAYTVTGRGDSGASLDGRIVDLSDPANPRVVGSFPSSHNLTIAPPGVMYLEAPGLRLFDLTADPLSPALIWSTSPANGHDATVAGGLLFDFHGSDGKIYDLSQYLANT